MEISGKTAIVTGAASGIGLGISSPSVAAGVANAVDDHDLGVASAAQQLMNNVGIVSGIQLMTTIQTSISHGTEGAAALPGFRAAYLVGGAVCIVGVLLATGVKNEHARPEPAAEGPLGRLGGG